jgi:hypothetical protein
VADGLFYKLLKKGVDGKLWRVLRDMFAKTSSRVSERSAVGCLPLAKELDGDLFAFDIYIDDLLDCLHECATEDAVAWVRGADRGPCLRTTSLLCPFTRRPATAY